MYSNILCYTDYAKYITIELQYNTIHCNTFLIQLSCNTGDCVTLGIPKKEIDILGESNRVRRL